MFTPKRSSQNFTPQKDQEINWNTFNGGWNSLFKPTELNPNELAQADNLMLTGKGTPTGRWGSDLYSLMGSGRVRLLDAFNNNTTNYLLAITDMGYMVKKSGASYTIITGASFASGYPFQSVELGKNTYIACASQNFIKFDGTNLIPYTGISAPTNVSIAQLSAASGYNTWSWLITANSIVGESLTSVSKTLASLPLDLTKTAIKVNWNAVSAAASTLIGYTIYRGTPGNETYLASVDPSATQYTDVGNPAASSIFPPSSDYTSGPKAKYILKVDDRLVLAGIQDDPSKFLVSARYPFHDRFTAIEGGGYGYASPDDGDEIMGLGRTNIQTTRPLIVVYKKYSTHIIDISNPITLGNFSILNPQVYLLSSSAGASSGDTVIPVENDTYSFGRKGLYSTGQEPQFLNQVRSNEISSRIRTYIQGLSSTDFSEACAAYIDYKYILSFPSRKETIIYDRQRMAFMGPWKTPFGITKWLKYYDSSGNEKWLAGCDDGYVREFSASYLTDSGQAITKILRTKKEDFKTWNQLKILKYFYFLMRNVRGAVQVNLRIEERTGNTVTSKTSTVTSQLGDGGFGCDMFGDQQFGLTEATVTLTGDELARYFSSFKQFRVLQTEVIANSANSNFEFLAIKASAVSLGPVSLPSSMKV